MNVSLTPELEELVTTKVRSGLYASASEVVREALRLLNERDAVREARLQEIRALVRVGVEQYERGEAIPGGPELEADIERRARAVIAARKQKA